LCYSYVLRKCNRKYCGHAQEGHVLMIELSGAFVEKLCQLLRLGVESRKATDPVVQASNYYPNNKRRRTSCGIPQCWDRQSTYSAWAHHLPCQGPPSTPPLSSNLEPDPTTIRSTSRPVLNRGEGKHFIVHQCYPTASHECEGTLT
jgi:hypothetical protein